MNVPPPPEEKKPDSGQAPSIVYLEYWDGKKWVPAGGPFGNENSAWISLGGDDRNYRTIGNRGKVLTDRRPTPKIT